MKSLTAKMASSLLVAMLANLTSGSEGSGFEYCNGYIDENGEWNTGFYCYRWGGPDEQYCCGDGNNRYCCPELDGDPYEEGRRSVQDHLPDCRELSQSCRGVPACCEDMVCYWENGFSARKDGVCVTCVDRTQTCHRDGQCCENTVCQKDNPWDVDGVCELRKEAGEECYRDKQCSSGDCDKSWYEVHGTCD